MNLIVQFLFFSFFFLISSLVIWIPRKVGMCLKTLLGAFCLLAFIFVLEKHGRSLSPHNHNRRDSDFDLVLVVLNLNRTLASVIPKRFVR